MKKKKSSKSIKSMKYLKTLNVKIPPEIHQKISNYKMFFRLKTLDEAVIKIINNISESTIFNGDFMINKMKGGRKK